MGELIASTYKIEKELGSGGGGIVYLAYHMRLGKQVVLKADKRKISTSQDLLRREVDVLKDLNHPYIPRVYDFFVEGETVYTVMDYIEGESLDKLLKRGVRFSQPQVIKWAKQLLEALSYLHSETHGSPPRGFVHSDIKPANLMLTPSGDICLIDFNIALALGEIHTIGRSAGYASPEHYGLDFTSEDELSDTESIIPETETMDMEGEVYGGRTETDVELKINGYSASAPGNAHAGKERKKVIIPDVRSDIYSTGATLYHFLKGERPTKDARMVVPLSDREISPQIVAIITRSMRPNPDLRYGTAAEMLYDFVHLREHDPRVKKLRRGYWISGAVFSVMFAAGAASAFVGLKRMQAAESWLKLAEYSKNALAEGDSASAIRYALSALPQKGGILEPGCKAEVQRALTNALGVYELADQYQSCGMVELPAVPFCLAISPNGKTASGVYAYSVAVFDTASAKILAELPAEKSALSEIKYLNDHTIIYAGDGGISVYNIERKEELWKGKPATSISVSADGKSVAAVYKNEGFATVYDVSNGKIKCTVDFHGKKQKVTVNDSFANPNDNLLALNSDGTMLGVSFEDGSLWVYHLEDSEKDIELFDNTSGYTHFEGGFYQEYFAFSATRQGESVFAVIDTIQAEQTGGFESKNPFSVQTDERGIYIQTENILVKIHPVTGEQTPLVTTAENILSYAIGGAQTLAASQKRFMFFDENAELISEEEKQYGGDLLQLAEGTALVGNRDSSAVRILNFESHPDAEVFSYDPSYVHDEARISQDGKTVMLFDYEGFRLYGIGGGLIQEVSIPNAEQVYDQQYIRDEEGSRLEVVYNDGTVLVYSAEDGNVLDEEMREKPDPSLDEEFFTDRLRIDSPLHGTPTAYDRKTGRLAWQLGNEDYLTYITQVGEYIVAQYVTADSYYYGQLLNGNGEVLADLPYLCDVVGETLIFDYPTGNMRKSHIYGINELMKIAQDKNKGGNGE